MEPLAVDQREFMRDSRSFEGPEGGAPVSIDRRLFRRLRKPKAAEPPEPFLPPERGAPGAHGRHGDFRGPREERLSAFEDLGAVPYGAKTRQRLAGNGLEDLDERDRFDFRDEGGLGFLALGSSDEFPGEARAEPVTLGPRSGSSPALRRHNAWFDGRNEGEQFSSDDPDPAASRDRRDRRDRRDAGLEELDLSPRMRRLQQTDDFAEDFGFASEHLRGTSWMTPSRRGRRKSDPVTRGAQLRDLWSRDRFLQSGNRKFDLRGCGPPQDVRRYNRHLAAPNYVAMHHKRGDEEQYQVRRQMRIPDYA